MAAPLRRFLAAALLVSLAFSAVPAGAETARLKVVASFSILADLVREVGGERVEVESLIGPDGEAHAFQPSPADAARLAGAAVVVVNGLGFEGWLDRLVASSGRRGVLVVASRGVEPALRGQDTDPHAWQDMANARLYVATIRQALAAADPDGRLAYEARAAAYLSRLDRLDGEIKARLDAIPPARRKVIATHDAFGYFGRAYGLRFVAARGVSGEAEPSARDLARIIRQVREERIPAVFLETPADARAAERLAKETGARIGGRLYGDALSGPDGPAPTYLDMMRHNAETLAAALAP